MQNYPLLLAKQVRGRREAVQGSQTLQEGPGSNLTQPQNLAMEEDAESQKRGNRNEQILNHSLTISST